jgi:hypothetical protein
MARCLAKRIPGFVFEDNLCSYEAYEYSVSQSEVKCEEGGMVCMMGSSAFPRLLRLVYYKTLRGARNKSL